MNRVPPNDLQAEASVLGAMILSRAAIDAVAPLLEPSHFYKPAHGHIYDAILTLYASSEPVDAVTLATTLTAAGVLDEIGGPSVLLDLQAATPAISNATQYAKTVADKAMLRGLVVAGATVADLGYNSSGDIETAVSEAEAVVHRATERNVQATSTPMRDAVSDYLDALEERAENGGKITGTPTGFADLDEMLSGFHGGKFYVLGGRPGMGKSMLAGNIVANIAMGSGLPAVVFSMEMSELELTERLVSADALVDGTRLRDGRLSDAEWTRISHSVGRLVEAPIEIVDEPDLNIQAVRSISRRMKSKLGALGVIVVDYFQLMSGRSNAESRQVELSEITRQLKILARELDVPVLALAQLNRQLEYRADKRPMLSDLRETGSTEQDADVVIFAYRDEVYYEDTPDKGIAELIIAKQRNGPTGRVRLACRPQYFRFDNLARSVPGSVPPSTEVRTHLNRIGADAAGVLANGNGSNGHANGPYQGDF